MAEPGSADDLARHLHWLYGPEGCYPGNVPCKCDHAHVGMGRLHGIDMGKGWVRTTTHPSCPHHSDRPRKRRTVPLVADGGGS